MTIETELFNYLNTGWDESPTISWANSNVTVTYNADTEYLVPSITLVDSEIAEVPASNGRVLRDYILGLNLLIKDNTGTYNSNTYATKLSTLFHKKDVSTTSFTLHFDALEVSQGFGAGAHFEVPVTIDFYVLST